MKKLFENFVNPSKEEWYKQAAKEIGSVEYLLSGSYEGILTQAIYTREDLVNINLPKLTLEKGNNSWLYLEEIAVVDEKTANGLAIEALQNGVDGIYFALKKEKVDINCLLDQIWIDSCLVSFKCEHNSALWLKDFLTYYNRNYQNPGELRGWINLSFDLSAESKGFKEDLYKTFHELTASFPRYYALLGGSEIFVDRGTDIIRELAYTLSMAVDHVESLTNAGVLPERAISNTLFSITVGTSFFFEISKLRALRLLWTKIAEGYGIELSPTDVQIHATTSYWHKSSLDKENNIIRDAAEAMGAIIGGCNYLSFRTVFPEEKGKEKIAKRTSRNISHILKEESFLDKVVDVSAGSYYIESLTKEIVEKSWALFLEIEEEGGFVNALKKSQIQESMKLKKQEKLRDLNLRNKLSIGANIYPNLQEYVGNVNQYYGRATYEIEKLRGWVEYVFSGRRTILIGSWEGQSNKRQSDLLKNIFNSAGFIIEYQNNLKASFKKDNYSKYLLILCLVEAEALGENDLTLLKELENQYPILFPGDSTLGPSINQISMEELAGPESLKKVLEKMTQTRK